MPIYEYQCQECQEEFELIVNRSTEPTCPKCQSNTLKKKLSVFSPNGKTGEHVHTGPGCACGNPQGGCGMN